VRYLTVKARPPGTPRRGRSAERQSEPRRRERLRTRMFPFVEAFNHLPYPEQHEHEISRLERASFEAAGALPTWTSLPLNYQR